MLIKQMHRILLRSRSKHLLFLVVTIGAFVLTGCGGALTGNTEKAAIATLQNESVAIAVTEELTVTPTSSPSLTATHTVTLTPAATQTATSTRTATATPTATLTPTVTQTPTITPSPTPTSIPEIEWDAIEAESEVLNEVLVIEEGGRCLPALGCEWIEMSVTGAVTAGIPGIENSEINMLGKRVDVILPHAVLVDVKVNDAQVNDIKQHPAMSEIDNLTDTAVTQAKGMLIERAVKEESILEGLEQDVIQNLSDMLKTLGFDDIRITFEERREPVTVDSGGSVTSIEEHGKIRVVITSSSILSSAG